MKFVVQENSQTGENIPLALALSLVFLLMFRTTSGCWASCEKRKVGAHSGCVEASRDFALFKNKTFTLTVDGRRSMVDHYDDVYVYACA